MSSVDEKVFYASYTGKAYKEVSTSSEGDEPYELPFSKLDLTELSLPEEHLCDFSDDSGEQIRRVIWRKSYRPHTRISVPRD